MPTSHMFRAHVLVPLGVLAVLLVIGVPLSGAVTAGMAVGCASMMLMMMGGHGGHGGDHRHDHDDSAGKSGPADRGPLR